MWKSRESRSWHGGGHEGKCSDVFHLVNPGYFRLLKIVLFWYTYTLDRDGGGEGYRGTSNYK